MPFTTIRIQTELRDELKTLGRKGETYEEIIRRLIEEAKRAESRGQGINVPRTTRSPLMPNELG